MNNRDLATIPERDVGVSPTPSPFKKKQNANTNELHTYFLLLEKIVFFFIIMNIIRIVFNDLSERINDQISDNQLESDNARKQYEEYKCDSKDRYPELNSECIKLAKIIQADPRRVEKLRISIRYLSNLLNDFINPLSPKTILMFIFLFALYQLKP